MRFLFPGVFGSGAFGSGVFGSGGFVSGGFVLMVCCLVFCLVFVSGVDVWVEVSGWIVFVDSFWLMCLGGVYCLRIVLG